VKRRLWSLPLLLMAACSAGPVREPAAAPPGVMIEALVIRNRLA
jgi:hypothetical protein